MMMDMDMAVGQEVMAMMVITVMMEAGRTVALSKVSYCNIAACTIFSVGSMYA